MINRRDFLLASAACAVPAFAQPAGRIHLAAGPLEMVFEPELAFLRTIRIGDVEIVRGIYAAVRDRNWGTVTPRVSGLRIQTTDDAFQADFDVTCRQDPIHYAWHGTIAGTPEGSVTFSFKGQAKSTFLRNRLGFCVLHPIAGCAGRPCTVTHTDGRVERGQFPLYVSPHQPFKQMAAIAHEVQPGLTAEVSFRGDVFEMEDHRNWTDASYKTYCTPLELPFPVEVKEGSTLEQEVRLTLRGPAKRIFGPRSTPVTIKVDDGPTRTLPSIGFQAAGPVLDVPTHPRRAHVRFETPAALPLTKVEIAVHLAGDEDAQLRDIGARDLRGVERWIIYHKNERSTSPKWIKLARKYLKGAIGGGTNAYFAELNRERPDPTDFDFICFSLNPQVHAFDDLSLVENLAAQADAVHSARQFAGGKPIVVTPVTLLPRFNPNATAASAPPPPDPRQKTPFCAAWTLGSIKYLSESGAASVTYYETQGPRGIMDAGGVFPVYNVFSKVLEFAGADVLTSRSRAPLEIESLVLRRGPRLRMILANVTDRTQVADVTWPSTAKALSIQKLGANGLGAVEQRVRGDTIVEVPLAPHAVAFLDSGA